MQKEPSAAGNDIIHLVGQNQHPPYRNQLPYLLDQSLEALRVALGIEGGGGRTADRVVAATRGGSGSSLNSNFKFPSTYSPQLVA